MALSEKEMSLRQELLRGFSSHVVSCLPRLSDAAKPSTYDPWHGM